MTVKQLIEKLETMGADNEIVVVCDEAKCVNVDVYFSGGYDAVVIEVD